MERGFLSRGLGLVGWLAAENRRIDIAEFELGLGLFGLLVGLGARTMECIRIVILHFGAAVAISYHIPPCA